MISKAQQRVVAHCRTNALACFAGGAIRSGKTTAQAMAFALWSAKEGVGFDHALIGQSVESGMRNVGYPLIKLYSELGIEAGLTRSLGSRIVFKYGGRDNNIWLLGAADERSRKRIQGSTLKGLMLDEVTLMPEEFF